jgi:hypothetical protein
MANDSGMTDEVLEAGYGRVRAKYDAPWGDYGSILVEGCFVETPDGTRHYGRVGPFVPPVFNGYGRGVLVRDDVATRLREAKLRGLQLEPLPVRPAVRFDWRPLIEKPLPPGGSLPDEIEERLVEGEPYSLVAEGEHDPELAAEMKLWSLRGAVVPRVSDDQGRSAWRRSDIADLDVIEDGRGYPEFSLHALELLAREAATPCLFYAARAID